MLDNPLTPERRKQFETLTLEIVKQDLAGGGHKYIGGPSAREAAFLWVQEQEAKKEQVDNQRHDQNIRIAKWAIAIAVVSLLISLVALFK